MYDKTVRRRRAVLAALVFASLAMLTAYFGESAGGGLHAIQRGAQDVLAPIESGTNRAVKPFRDLVAWTGDVLGAEGENDRLEKEVEQLRRELARAQTAQGDARQLRALADLRAGDGFPADADLLTARVIAHSPTAWHAKVQIDKGSGDGVRENQPVINGDGLIGKVTAVTGGSAQVTLITDSTSFVSAKVMPEGVNGVVRPKVADPDDLLLDFVEKGRPIARGRTVVTAGSRSSRLESIFPRGIPIARVTRVDEEEFELYQRVHVKPFADLRRIELLQVVTSPSPVEGEQASAP